MHVLNGLRVRGRCFLGGFGFGGFCFRSISHLGRRIAPFFAINGNAWPPATHRAGNKDKK